MLYKSKTATARVSLVRRRRSAPHLQAGTPVRRRLLLLALVREIVASVGNNTEGEREVEAAAADWPAGLRSAADPRSARLVSSPSPLLSISPLVLY
jgi:hypothetical protein